MSTVERFCYLALGVEALDAWKRFSTHVIGLQSVGHTEDGRRRFAWPPHGNDSLIQLAWRIQCH
jgi:hypothetical protein